MLFTLLVLALLGGGGYYARAEQTDQLILAGSQTVFATTDGSYLLSLNTVTYAQMNMQIKKLLGIDSKGVWNTTTVRGLSDQALVNILLLALVGNFTTGGTSSWEQPCTVQLNPDTGLFVAKDMRGTVDQILSVLVIILCMVHLKQIIDNLSISSTKT